jgi:hypothetical protein
MAIVEIIFLIWLEIFPCMLSNVISKCSIASTPIDHSPSIKKCPSSKKLGVKGFVSNNGRLYRNCYYLSVTVEMMVEMAGTEWKHCFVQLLSIKIILTACQVKKMSSGTIYL